MTSQSASNDKAGIDLDAIAKALGLIAVILPISAVLTRLLALFIRFKGASITLAVAESLGGLTAQGALIAGPALLLAGIGYFQFLRSHRRAIAKTNSPSEASIAGQSAPETRSTSDPKNVWAVLRTAPGRFQAAPRRERLLIVAIVLLIVLTIVLAPGFPGTTIVVVVSPFVGAVIGRHATSATWSLADVAPLIVGTALVTAVVYGICGEIATSAGDFTFSRDSGVPNGRYVEVASTTENLLYLTPCDGTSTLIAVRFDEVSRVVDRRAIGNPSLVDLYTGSAPSWGYPNRC